MILPRRSAINIVIFWCLCTLGISSLNGSTSVFDFARIDVSGIQLNAKLADIVDQAVRESNKFNPEADDKFTVTYIGGRGRYNDMNQTRIPDGLDENQPVSFFLRMILAPNKCLYYFDPGSSVLYVGKAIAAKSISAIIISIPDDPIYAETIKSHNLSYRYLSRRKNKLGLTEFHLSLPNKASSLGSILGYSFLNNSSLFSKDNEIPFCKLKEIKGRILFWKIEDYERNEYYLVSTETGSIIMNRGHLNYAYIENLERLLHGLLPDLNPRATKCAE